MAPSRALDDDETLGAAVEVEDLASGEWTVEPVSVEAADHSSGAADGAP